MQPSVAILTTVGDITLNRARRASLPCPSAAGRSPASPPATVVLESLKHHVARRAIPEPLVEGARARVVSEHIQADARDVLRAEVVLQQPERLPADAPPPTVFHH